MSLEAIKQNGHNLHLGNFETVGKYDIPIITPVHFDERIKWLPFSAALKTKDRWHYGIQFFLDDYIFERCWNFPYRYAEVLKDYCATFSPDFSLFTNWPFPVQLYNHWRKHMLGAFYQSQGITVIPSICWSDESSFEWCFDGEPVGGCVAVSSVGTQKNKRAKQLFLAGYHEMMERLQPEKIIFFGAVPDGCEGNIERHETFYAGLAHAQKKR